ncbi:MAG: sigma factor-like helix-turn-helix DNA-binding protein, partial [Acidimicrobiales bacterium]
MAHLDDARLVEMCRLGGAGAYEEIYRRHAPAAWRTAVAVIADHELAAEATARAFAGVLGGGAGRSRPSTGATPSWPGGLRTELLAATRATAVEAMRCSDPRPDDQPTPAPAPLPPVVAALRRLPERWRSVLWLTEVEGLPLDEAAVVLGVSTEGVAQLAARARTGLLERAVLAIPPSPAETAACRATTGRLAALVAGRLTEREQAGADEHLARCPACRERLAQVQGSTDSLRASALGPPVGMLAA